MATPRGTKASSAAKASAYPGDTFNGTFMTSGDGEGVLLGDLASEHVLEDLKAAADAALRPKSYSENVKSESWEERQTRPGSSNSRAREEDIPFENTLPERSYSFGGRKPQPAESAFLQSLRAAHFSAIAAGDLEAAKAVEDAIRAEGGVLPSRLPQPAPSKTNTASGEFGTIPSARPSGRPRADAGRPQRPTQKPVETACADFKARRTRVQEIIEAQLGSDTASARSKVQYQTADPRKQAMPQEEEEEYEDDGAEDTSEAQGPVRLGKMVCAPSHSAVAALFLQADKASSKRQHWASKDLPGLNIETNGNGALSAGSTQSLPPSELPRCCREAVKSWAAGRSSGYRCLVKLSSNLPGQLKEAAWDKEVLPGICSWQSLVSVAGLAGGEELLASRSKTREPSFFAMTPSRCMRNTVHAVRVEAGLAECACLTLEELHLGLRSLELRARGAQGANVALLQAVAGRELLHATLEGLGNFSQEDMEAADALAQSFALGAAALERNWREQSPEELRQLPDGWETCRSFLASFARRLREELESVRTYGPYAALGVECDAPDSAIRRAYRDLCLRHHPDKGGDTTSFQNLQQAHEQIMEDRRKGLRPRKPDRHTQKSPGAPRSPERSEAQKAPSSSRGERQASSTAQEASAGAKSRPEEKAKACGEELLQEVARLRQEGFEAAQHSRCAAEAVKAAVSLGEGDWLSAMNSLLRDYSDVVESSAVAASTSSRASSRVLAAGVLGTNEDQASPDSYTQTHDCKVEAIMAVSLRCAEASASCADASAAASVLGRQASEALQVAREAESQDADDISSTALELLARRCMEAASIAAAAALVAADALAAAEAAAEAVLRGTRRTCENSSGSRENARHCPEESQADAGHSFPPRQSRARDKPADPGPQTNAWEQSPSSPPGSAQKCSVPEEASSSPGSFSSEPPPSSNSGARCTEALVRRRLESLEELENLNTEVLKLQRELLGLLLASPLLLPKTGQKQRARVFALVAEILLEVAQDGRNNAVLLLEQLGGNPSVALCNSRVGILRLAALIDLEMLSELLKGQLLPRLVETQPERRAALDTAVARTLESLRNWVSGK